MKHLQAKYLVTALAASIGLLGSAALAAGNATQAEATAMVKKGVAFIKVGQGDMRRDPQGPQHGPQEH